VRLIASVHQIHLHLRAGFNFYTSLCILLVTVTGSGFKVQGSGLKAKNETVFGCIRLKCYRRFKRNLKWKIGVVGCELLVVGCER